MSDNLKDRIINEREDFELYPFDTKAGWDEISSRINRPKKWPTWKVVSVAATVALVLLSSWYQSIPLSSSASNPVLSEMEQYYHGEINEKIMLVKQHVKDPRVLEDLEIMDQAFSELKNDLRENVDNEEVVQAMMENYRLKLRILEEILSELEKERSETSL
ncbi:MAG: hypothetical protein Tsb0034_28120 [Ekhidna sp.]